MKPALLIVGLGNPGASYTLTRHNIGWQALDVLSESYGTGEWKDTPKFLAQTQEARIVTVPVLLVKPQTYMNRSGESVRKLIDFYKLDPAEQLLVISDDIDLPVGTTRLRRQGGPGTHNGMKSIVEQFGEGFGRLRIGLGARPAQADLANWVLSVPTPEDRPHLEQALVAVPALVREFVLGESNS